MLSASADSKLKVWDLIEGRPFYTLRGHTGPVESCAFSPEGDYFASAGADQQVLGAVTQRLHSGYTAVTQRLRCAHYALTMRPRCAHDVVAVRSRCGLRYT